MAGLTRYNRYPRDYLGGTRTLSLEAKGLYNDLIDSMYDTGGPLPYDVQHLCRLCGVRDKRTLLKPLNELILAGKIRVLGDTLVNDRTMSEIEEATQHIENGRGGGRPRNPREASQSVETLLAVTPTASGLKADCAPTPTPGFVENQSVKQNPPTPTPRPIEEEKRSAGEGAVAGQPGPLIDVIPLEVPTAPSVGQPPPAPPDDPVAEIVMPAAVPAKPIHPWLRLIQVFDEVRTQVFGENLARPYPDANDKIFAERWIKLGVDEDLCRAVFFKKCEYAKNNGDTPPYTLKFCNDSIERTVRQRRQIQNMPIEEGTHHGKANFALGAGVQSAHGSLFAAAAVVDARLRKAKPHA